MACTRPSAAMSISLANGMNQWPSGSDVSSHSIPSLKFGLTAPRIIGPWDYRTLVLSIHYLYEVWGRVVVICNCYTTAYLDKTQHRAWARGVVDKTFSSPFANIHLYQSATSAGLRSVSHKAAVLWNELPLTVKCTTLFTAFKRNIKKYLLSLYWNYICICFNLIIQYNSLLITHLFIFLHCAHVYKTLWYIKYIYNCVTVTLTVYARLFINWAMLWLQARAQVLLPAVIECISRRHSGVAQQLRYVGQFHRCQGTSTKSAATRAADTEYKPIKKLLVANRGNRCSHLFFCYSDAPHQHCDLWEYWDIGSFHLLD